MVTWGDEREARDDEEAAPAGDLLAYAVILLLLGLMLGVAWR